MEIQENKLKAQDFKRLFASAGWGNLDLAQIQIALDNSLVTFTVSEGEDVIGMARLLGDKALAYYLKDFVISPDWQGKGIGGKLLTYVCDYIKKEVKTGWTPWLELASAKGKEGFYQKYGFELRPQENRGAGMYLIINDQKTNP